MWGVSASNLCIAQGSTAMPRRKVRPREMTDMPKLILLDKGRAGLAPKSYLTAWEDTVGCHSAHSDYLNIKGAFTLKTGAWRNQTSDITITKSQLSVGMAEPIAFNKVLTCVHVALLSQQAVSQSCSL